MDYYIDSREGDNANSGSSSARPWGDFTPINDKALRPGDRLLLKRGSHFHQQLRLSAVGTAVQWIEIAAYGEGPRPVIQGRSDLPCGEIHYSGTLDESTPCVHVTEAAFLKVSHLTVYHAFYGLLINNFNEDHSHIQVEDIIALDIQNFGQEEPRVNSAGIEIVVGRGQPCRNVTMRDVTIRNCECVHTGCGFSFRAYGQDSRLENVRAEKITAHDNANTPWSYVGFFLSRVHDSEFRGVCLDGCAPHWKPTGTATVHYCHSDRVVVKDSYIANTQDTDSHDMGGWDYEGGGNDSVIENCTFENNAGPAIEFLRTEPTIQNACIRNCTFIHNDWNLWGGAGAIHLGRSGLEATGEIHDNNFVLAPNTCMGGGDKLDMRGNREFPDRDSLPLFLEPPRVDAGLDRTIADLTTSLAGSVSNADTYQWEAVIAPGDVVFDDASSLQTGVRFSAPGTYVLRLFAENEHFIYGDYLTIRCVADPDAELLGTWSLAGQDAGVATESVDLGQGFSALAWVKVSSACTGTQTVLANTGDGPQANGFKLWINTPGTTDGTILLETGNGIDCDLAHSRPGVFTFDTWHHLGLSVDASSQDGRGEARLVLDGQDVTLFSGVQSDCRTSGALQIGRMPESDPVLPYATPISEPEGMPGLPPVALPSDFELVFVDDFAQGLGPDWKILSGDWRVEDGQLVTQGKSELLCLRRFPTDIALVYDAASDKAGDLSATLNAMPENGPMFGYFFGFGTAGNTVSRFMRRTGPIAEYDARIVPGQVHRVACLRHDKTLSHVIDGQTVFAHQDSRPLSNGRQPYVSLYVHTCGRFDNVRIYAKRNPEVGTLRALTGSMRDLRLHGRVLSVKEMAYEHQQAEEPDG